MLGLMIESHRGHLYVYYKNHFDILGHMLRSIITVPVGQPLSVIRWLAPFLCT